VRCEDTRRITGSRNAARVRDVRVERTLILLALEALEEEQPVLDDRTARPFAGVGRLESTWSDGLSPRLRADERIVAVPIVAGSDEAVGPAPRDGVDVRADEIALPDVVWRDADLHLLDRFERDRRDTCAISRLISQAEGVVEVRAVHRDVVHPVVGAG